MDRHIPRAGEFYRHFKNRLYQIINIAIHSESGESLVVYQALYGEFKVYARPLNMFMSEVDREKYPNVEQEYRFEQVEFVKEEFEHESAQKTGEDKETKEGEEAHEEENGGSKKASEYLLAFMDAETYEAKKMALVLYKTKFSQIDVDCIYELLGIQNFGGNIRAQVASLIQYLDMREQYEGERLRK